MGRGMKLGVRNTIMINPSVFDHLGIGQTGSFLCPSCEGGSSRERTMTVNKDAYGVVKWYCFRASCGEKGTSYAVHGDMQINSDQTPPKPELRPYRGAMHNLTSASKEFFKGAYNLDFPDIYEAYDEASGGGRYILPIRKLDGSIRGHISRHPWKGAPIDGHVDLPKSLTYWHKQGPLLAWYYPADPNDDNDCYAHPDKVLLVEDQLSAMRAVDHLNVATCALLGTGINAEKVAEIQQNAKYVVIALDSDATGHAFNMARRWGQAFDSCKVLVLTHDIKDMPLEQLKALSI